MYLSPKPKAEAEKLIADTRSFPARISAVVRRAVAEAIGEGDDVEELSPGRGLVASASKE